MMEIRILETYYKYICLEILLEFEALPCSFLSLSLMGNTFMSEF